MVLAVRDDVRTLLKNEDTNFQDILAHIKAINHMEEQRRHPPNKRELANKVAEEKFRKMLDDLAA